MITHPEVKEPPVPLEIYLRGDHGPEHLKVLGREMGALLRAYEQGSPRLFENFLNMSGAKPRWHTPYGLGMRMYEQLDPRSLGVVQTPEGPKLRVIEPSVLGYHNWRIGVGPFLRLRYAHVGEMGYVFEQRDGKYVHIKRPGAAPSENFEVSRRWAAAMEKGENPRADLQTSHEKKTVEFHDEYDRNLDELMKSMPPGEFRSRDSFMPE
jgi:hypothetical protein